MQNNITQEAGQAARRWIKENIDFPLVLAMVTETPRWTVAFIAIHEPLWIGIPLGILLAFATSKAWRYYFRTGSKGMLIFNVISVLMAITVITPVLFAMTEVPPDQVQIGKVLSDLGVWVWTAILALTTFIPLIQLAAVEKQREAPQEPQEAQEEAEYYTGGWMVEYTETPAETPAETYTAFPVPYDQAELQSAEGRKAIAR